jgi:Holliday junction DNA helicase RuvA
MLAVHTPDGLRRAVAAQDLTSLMKVPGIGRKGAQRIVLELTDRLGAPVSAPGSELSPAPANQVAAAAGWRQQVTDALVGLGWQPRQASDAVDAVAGSAAIGASSGAPGAPGGPVEAGAPGDAGEAGQTPEIAVVLRAALRHLGRSA